MNRPAPLVPAEVDLRGYEFMPLYGQHLFGSDFNSKASDTGWRAALTLWWAAWNQVPAASLPNDDVALTRLADFGRDLRSFRKIRDEALHGFVECEDGRLYHRQLSRWAIEAWDRRVKERERKAAYRAGKRDKSGQGTGQMVGQTMGQGRDVPAEGKRREGKRREGKRTHDGRLKPTVSGETPDGTKADQRTQELADNARELLAFLNERGKKRFPPTDSNVGVLVARQREGFTPAQIRQVIAMRVRMWGTDPEMREFLRPMTLFGPIKFSNYVGELVGEVEPEDQAAAPVEGA